MSNLGKRPPHTQGNPPPKTFLHLSSRFNTRSGTSSWIPRGLRLGLWGSDGVGVPTISTPIFRHRRSQPSKPQKTSTYWTLEGLPRMTPSRRRTHSLPETRSTPRTVYDSGPRSLIPKIPRSAGRDEPKFLPHEPRPREGGFDRQH